MTTLNLGILAHVDAGKTSLTERLLYTAGVIDEVGSVDAGNTRTDTLPLEQRRGITIRSAVVSFTIAGVTVNLVDTPGHSDFIAEVERALAVLDGAVLVVSAVEGVQAQTRVLMRALARLRIPTLLFVNKIDRTGADPDAVVAQISERLSRAVVTMTSVDGAGGPDARVVADDLHDRAHADRLTEVLTEHDDALLADWVDGGVAPERLHAALVDQTTQARVHPVYFGSAMTGAGIRELSDGVAALLPATTRDPTAALAGIVFKVERGPAGENVAYVRVDAGTIRVRDRLRLRTGEHKVTAIRVFDDGSAQPRDEAPAGRIAQVWGLSSARVGDLLGTGDAGTAYSFGPPTLETVVDPLAAADRVAMHAALTRLAEQDPLIDLRQDDVRQEISVSLYGEVQKQVIGTTLSEEFGVDVTFRESTTICVERVTGTGAAYELLGSETNPFRATVGLRVDPADPGNGVAFGLEVERGSMPSSFFVAVEQTVRSALREGLHGWHVLDCTVTMTHSGYVPPPPYGWSALSSAAGDFRSLTPLVLTTALRRAGTQVLEPVNRFDLEIPADTLGATLAALARVRAVPLDTEPRGPVYLLTGELPAGRTNDLQRLLPSLTRGEGVLTAAFERYRPVPGRPPNRDRSARPRNARP